MLIYFFNIVYARPRLFNINNFELSLAELDPEPVASMVPESVSSALKYLGGPSMLSYHTPSTLSSFVKPVKKLSSVVPYETKNAVSSNAISLKTTKTNDDHMNQGKYLMIKN